jgi:hypothetical protein
MAKLTPRQIKFIEAYVTIFNASKAALIAGYSPNGIAVRGSMLLADASIKEAIDERLQEIVAKTDDKRALVLAFWQSVIDDPKAPISAKLKASDMMAKYLMMYGNTLEISGTSGAPIRVLWDE